MIWWQSGAHSSVAYTVYSSPFDLIILSASMPASSSVAFTCTGSKNNLMCSVLIPSLSRRSSTSRNRCDSGWKFGKVAPITVTGRGRAWNGNAVVVVGNAAAV